MRCRSCHEWTNYTVIDELLGGFDTAADEHTAYSTTEDNLALIANPATTLVKELDCFTFSCPKICTSISVNKGILDDPPVFTTASISSISSPDWAIVSSRTFSTSTR